MPCSANGPCRCQCPLARSGRLVRAATAITLAATTAIGWAPPRALAQSSDAEVEASRAGPFARGRVDLGLRLGNASTGDDDYLIVGASGGYYVLDGLQLGLGASLWLFGDPLVGTLTPEAKYVLHFVPVVKPYVGSFFRRYLIAAGQADISSVGGRTGFHLESGHGYYGLGVVYERLLACSSASRDCDDWYPELTIALSF